MGFRFRKSKNLGGGFRLNFSKSGIGGSWGVKGFRVTKKAKGGFRTTASIPGTGISYSTDSKSGLSGCLTIFIIWPIKLAFWMIYGAIWLCFILPIKGIVKLCKSISSSQRNTSKSDKDVSSRGETANSHPVYDTTENKKHSAPQGGDDCVLELLLCLLFGWLGLHKFYRKKIGLGILYIFTLGILGIGWATDTILLIINLVKKKVQDSKAQ